MDRKTTRGLAAGLLIAALALFGYDRWAEPQQRTPAKAEDAVSKADYEKAVNEAKELREKYDALSAEHEALLAEKPVADTAKEEKEPDTFLLVIREGSTSKEISRQLEERGIVEKADEFDQYLADRGLQEYIQIGEYEIKKGMAFGEIASLIAKDAKSR